MKMFPRYVGKAAMFDVSGVRSKMSDFKPDTKQGYYSLVLPKAS